MKKPVTGGQGDGENNPSCFLSFTYTDTLPKSANRNLEVDTTNREDSLKKGLGNMIESQPGKKKAFKPHIF